MTELKNFQRHVEKSAQEMQHLLDQFPWILEMVQGNQPACVLDILPTTVDPSMLRGVVSAVLACFQNLQGAVLMLDRLIGDSEDDCLADSFCRDCPRRDGGECTEPCGPLIEELPAVTKGALPGVVVGIPQGAAILDAVSGQDRYADLIEKYGMFCLTLEQRKAIVMHFRENLVIRVIAKRLNIGERAVRALLARGMQRLVQARRDEFAWALQLINRMREERYISSPTCRNDPNRTHHAY